MSVDNKAPLNDNQKAFEAWLHDQHGYHYATLTGETRMLADAMMTGFMAGRTSMKTQSALKDNEVRELVNALTVVTKEYVHTQQLRARIASCVTDALSHQLKPVIKPTKSQDYLAEAIAFHERTWPRELTSGVMFFKGQRITKLEFEGLVEDECGKNQRKP